MMKWSIPAKTFLSGEYAAMLDGSAIILTTTPCFELSLITGNESSGIHPDSPAGQWWARHGTASFALHWQDPYQGLGGLGASSAQFLGAWLASCHLENRIPEETILLNDYFQHAWQGKGLRPSGYDVLAQSRHQCVYINRHKNILESYDWPFADLGFILLHSGQKLATHDHLLTTQLPDGVEKLSAIVEQTRLAFEQADSEALVQAVNAYHQQLTSMQLVNANSLKQLEVLKADKAILAAKGCGAMGADVLLLIVRSESLELQVSSFIAKGLTVLASSANLYKGQALMKNIPAKTLELMS